MSQNFCDLSKLLPLLPNLTLKDDTLIALKYIYDKITLKLTASIKKSRPIVPGFDHIYIYKSLLNLLVPSGRELFLKKACQTWLVPDFGGCFSPIFGLKKY